MDEEIEGFDYYYKEFSDGNTMAVVKRYSKWSERYNAEIFIYPSNLDKTKSFYYINMYVIDIKDYILKRNNLSGLQCFPRLKTHGVHLNREESKEVINWLLKVIKPKDEMRDDFIDDLLDD